MKRCILLLLLVISASAYSQKATIDNTASKVTFHFLEDDVKGSIEGFRFTGNFDPNDLEGSTLSGTVETKTLDTNNWLRSRHLRAKKFFSAKEHPQLLFKSSSLSGTGERFIAKGTLTIKGISKPVTFNFKKDTNNKLLGNTTINTQDFDISIHDEKEKNKVKITVVLVLR